MMTEVLVNSIKGKMEDFEISVSDLKAPTSRFVQSYFKRLLLELDIDVEQFQITPKQSDEFTCYNSARHVLPLIDLFGAVNYVARHIGVNDFSLSDLIQPRPQRTINLLNVFDWFHSQADWMAQEIQEEMPKITRRKEELKMLQEQVEKKKMEIINENEECSMIPAYVKEIKEGKQLKMMKEKELAELEEKLAGAQIEFKKVNQRHNKVSAEFTKLQERRKEVQSLISLASEKDQLKSMLKEYREKKEACEKMKQNLGEMIQQKSQLCNASEKCLLPLEHATEKLESYLELHKNHEIIQDRLKTEQDRITSVSSEIQVLMDRMAKLNSKEELLKTQETAFKTTCDKDKSEWSLKVQEAEKEVNNLLKEHDDTAYEIEEMKFRLKNHEQEDARLKALYDSTCDELYKKLEQKAAKDRAALKMLGYDIDSL